MDVINNIFTTVVNFVSQYTGDIFTLIGVFVTFFLLFVVLPFIVIGFKVDGPDLLYNVIAAFCAGAGSIIIIVYILSALKLLNFWALVAAIIIYIAIMLATVFRKRTQRHLNNFVEFVFYSIKGLHKRKLVLKEFRRYVFHKYFVLLKKIFSRPYRLLAFLAAIGSAAWIRGYYPITELYFSYPDVYVHTDWTKQMMAGNVFPTGVYPFGMHNMIAAQSTLFHIDPITVIRFFGLIMALMSIFSVYVLLSKLFKSQAATGIGLMVYTMAGFLPIAVHARQSSTLPQEAGLVFIMPCAMFFAQYVKTKQLKHLVYLAMAFSLTISMHFYITIMALLLLIAMFIVYFRQILKGKLLLKILLGAVLSVIVAVAPFGVGLAAGKGWEPSMRWALSIIFPVSNDQAAQQQEQEQQQIQQTTQNDEDITAGEDIPLIDRVATDFLDKPLLYYSIFAGGGLILMGFIFVIFRRQAWYGRMLMGFGIYALFVILVAAMPSMGLPMLLDKGRLLIFYGQCTTFLFGVAIEIVMLPMSVYKTPPVKFANFVFSLIFSVYYIFSVTITGYQVYGENFQSSYSSAVEVYYQITRRFQPHQWCIVGTTNELNLVRNVGWHYELLRLLKNLDNTLYSEYPEEDFNPEFRDIRIPGNDLFFFIEKRPLHANRTRTALGHPEAYGPEPQLTEADAEKDFAALYEDAANRGMLSDLYNIYDDRRIVMAKAYYWMQEYEKYFPEMNIFYEDDDLIVYHLRQTDPYALNNFYIDYGYN